MGTLIKFIDRCQSLLSLDCLFTVAFRKDMVMVGQTNSCAWNAVNAVNAELAIFVY